VFHIFVFIFVDNKADKPYKGSISYLDTSVNRGLSTIFNSPEFGVIKIIILLGG